MADVRAVAGTAYGGVTGHVAVSVVRSTVDAVAGAVDTSGATAVDLHALAAVLREAVREGVSAGLAAKRVDEQSPVFGAIGRFLNANPGLLALVATIIAVLAFMQDRVANEQPDPPPSVSVQVEPPDRAEVERIVEERLRELGEPAEQSPANTQEH